MFTVANCELIRIIRFVAKSYVHLWKNFANKLHLVLHAYKILFRASSTTLKRGKVETQVLARGWARRCSPCLEFWLFSATWAPAARSEIPRPAVRMHDGPELSFPPVPPIPPPSFFIFLLFIFRFFKNIYCIFFCRFGLMWPVQLAVMACRRMNRRPAKCLLI